MAFGSRSVALLDVTRVCGLYSIVRVGASVLAVDLKGESVLRHRWVRRPGRSVGREEELPFQFTAVVVPVPGLVTGSSCGAVQSGMTRYGVRELLPRVVLMSVNVCDACLWLRLFEVLPHDGCGSAEFRL